eukprot:TRINITY_DN72551_c0_g1_i1.p1 TRINITY_DN72551_c0_g1~~TRINITY_DN72551_c0_g1_i1.p1  ORF type:complete len:340 (-),score=83.31 TRINITY_DN72551_c0_g1_i1:65-1084(-)
MACAGVAPVLPVLLSISMTVPNDDDEEIQYVIKNTFITQVEGDSPRRQGAAVRRCASSPPSCGAERRLRSGAEDAEKKAAISNTLIASSSAGSLSTSDAGDDAGSVSASCYECGSSESGSAPEACPSTPTPTLSLDVASASMDEVDRVLWALATPNSSGAEGGDYWAPAQSQPQPQQPQRGRTALNSRARAWNPPTYPAASQSDVQPNEGVHMQTRFSALAHAGKSAMQGCDAVEEVNMSEVAGGGWLIVATIPEAQQEAAFKVLTLAGDAVLAIARDGCAGVYVLGADSNPFEALHGSMGFRVRAALIEDQSNALWGACRWIHPSWQAAFQFEIHIKR